MTGGGPSRRLLLVAALGGGVTGLAGCVGLAGSGPIQTGGPIGGGNPQIPITVSALLPAAGADPSQILLGFLDASAVPGPGYGTARAYLTPAAADAWDPTEAVTVYNGSVRAARSGPLVGTGSARTTSVGLEAPAVGALDRRGGWTETAPITFPVTMHLRIVDGEWRIEDPPPGLLVSQNDFTRIWLSYRLYFFDPAGQVLVPDPVYLPDRGAGVPQLMQALVAGPSSWVAPVVRSAIPAGSRLGSATVEPTDGQATVDLEHLPALGEQPRTLLDAQLVQTLAQVSQVVTVSVLAGGSPLAVPGVAAQQPSASWPQYAADVLTAAGGDLSVLRSGSGGRGTVLLRGDPGALHQIALPTQASRAPRPAFVATDPQSNQLVVVDATQTRVSSFRSMSATATAVVLATGTALARPQVDRSGLIWLLDQPGGSSRLRVVGPGTAVQTVAVDLGQQSGAQLRRVVLSRDGQRAAVVLRSAGQDQLMLELVIRSGPLQLESPRYVLGPVPQILDVAWVDSVTLVVLISGPNATASVVRVDCDGSDQMPLGTPPADSISIAAGPFSRPPVVGTSSGVILAQLDTTPPTWTRVQAGAGYAPVFPG